MADTLTTTTTVSTIPNATVIATDDCGAGGHTQIVKLAISTDGSATPITADANGLEVQGAGTAGTPAGGVVSVQGVASGTAVPVSLASVPSHAVTNAGTFATQVDGSALTSLQTIDNIVLAEDSVHGNGDSGVMLLAVRRDAASSGVSADGDYAALSVTSDGSLRVAGSSGTTQYAEDAVHTTGDSMVFVGAIRRDTTPSSSAGTAGDYAAINVDANGRLYTNTVLYAADGSALTADTQGTHDTALGTITSVTGGMTMLRASAAAPSNVSADDDAVLPWALRSGAQVVQLSSGGTLVGIADDAAFTPGTSAVLPAGFEADETSTDSVDEGDCGAARMTLDRKVIVTPQPHTTGGLSTFMASGSDGSTILQATAQAIKASAGQMYGYYLYNPESAVTFVHFYNVAAASVTVGTTNPLFTIPVPATSAANLMFTHGVTFSNAGWSCSATTTAGGNTSPTTGVSAVIWYV